MNGGVRITLAEARRLAMQTFRDAERRIYDERRKEADRPDSIEVRRDSDGTLDEIVAKGATVHLERLNDGEAYMTIDTGAESWRVAIGAKGKGSRLYLRADQEE